MGARLVAEFFVPGLPIPQGSKSARVQGGRAVIYDDNAKVLKPWRELVTATARAAYSGPRIEGAVQLECEFRFVRPPSVRRRFMTVKPDVDKLQRALFDGITDAGIWRDDAQVTHPFPSKVYAERPGVQVRIGEFREESK
jgi:Holliday junction resolvase RusA-like endonuclease